jgi:hypothetical protein
MTKHAKRIIEVQGRCHLLNNLPCRNGCPIKKRCERDGEVFANRGFLNNPGSYEEYFEKRNITAKEYVANKINKALNE